MQSSSDGLRNGCLCLACQFAGDHRLTLKYGLPNWQTVKGREEIFNLTLFLDGKENPFSNQCVQFVHPHMNSPSPKRFSP
jgi:hypothetical protein